MNGVHDMGGMHGFGNIERGKEDEPTFNEPWEGRIFALVLGSQAPRWSGRDFESLEPTVYLASSYYERWVRAFENLLIRVGILSRQELESRSQQFHADRDASVPISSNIRLMQEKITALKTRLSPEVPCGIKPAYTVGQSVRTRNINPSGHTRLPRYTRGKVGKIVRFHGIHEIHDDISQEQAGGPQPVYAVRFAARELWGPMAERRDSVSVDMWESYLCPL